jgi:hypothetical protein
MGQLISTHFADSTYPAGQGTFPTPDKDVSESWHVHQISICTKRLIAHLDSL